MGRTRSGWRLLAVVAAVVLCAGCTEVERLSVPAPDANTPAPSVTLPPATLPDTSGVILPVVAGVTTTTKPAVTGGSATISGTVIGPSGVVGGATVEAERVVGDAEAAVKGTTGADGAFSLSGLIGGDYRVLAWMPPSLELTTPQVLYLGAGEDEQLTLQLDAMPAPAVAAAIDPDPPTVNQPANVAVQVTTATVGPDGVIRHPVTPGALVELTNGPGWLVLQSNPLTTAADGEAVFEVACVGVGVQPLDAAVNGQEPQALDVPSCLPTPAPTTAPPPTAATTTTAPSTTTPPATDGSGSTTTTSSSTTSVPAG